MPPEPCGLIHNLPPCQIHELFHVLGLEPSDKILAKALMRALSSVRVQETMAVADWHRANGRELQGQYIQHHCKLTTQGYAPPHELHHNRPMGPEDVVRASSAAYHDHVQRMRPPEPGIPEVAPETPVAWNAQAIVAHLVERLKLYKSAKVLFYFLDQNKSGKIEADDFLMALPGIGVAVTATVAQELVTIFPRRRPAEADFNVVEYHDLCHLVPYHGYESYRPELEPPVLRTDLDPEKLRYMLQNANPEALLSWKGMSGEQIFAEVISQLEMVYLSIRACFQHLDRDQSGDISTEEFAYEINRRGILVEKEAIDRLMEYLDENGDGEISYDEFFNRAQEALHKRARAIVVNPVEKNGSIL